MKRGVAILGSTGSIGTQALEVLAANSDRFDIELLTSNTRYETLIEQARLFQPNAVVICDETKYIKVKEALSDLPIKVYSGLSSVSQLMEMDAIHVVLTAMVGYAGLEPTMSAIRNKKNIALANKETLVVAGELITQLAAANAVNIYPVDSEHSAIFQCLAGEFHNKIEKIYLTASGGPFRGKDAEFLSTVTKEQALKHPNWSMGSKITIDSATLMNKGLEMIEAKWLFSLKPEQIDVIVHPQSIIHSIVQFEDGSMKAQMGLPDMKLPIQYALAYPERLPSSFPRFNFAAYPTLTFENPDRATFRCLSLAETAMNKGGNMACIMNAANEVAVDAFLKDKLSFSGIAGLIETCMEQITYKEKPDYDDYIMTDAETRKFARTLRKKPVTG
ncbi:MAG: 1-deoxy-D-xylulose-5-phosphate reductoisomerase [Bacteroidota bacterium]